MTKKMDKLSIKALEAIMTKQKQVILGLGFTVCVIFILALVKYFQINAAMAGAASHQPPPETVTSYIATQESWPRVLSAVGSLSAVKGAVLSAEETGKIVSINFKSGEQVLKDQLLVEIDYSVEASQLKGAQAQLELSKLNAQRQRSLRAKKANAQSDLDNAEAELESAQAEVARLSAIIKRKQIIAPYSGKTGIRSVNLGDTVTFGDPIVSLNSYEELNLDFNLPQSVLRVVKPGQKVELDFDAYPNLSFIAKVTATESEINQNTRNFSVQARLKNTKRKLKPGMFASIKLFLPTEDQVVAIPASSIQYAPYGDSVWLIEAGTVANQPRPVKSQIVKLGRRLGDRIAIESGLKADQEIVSSGVFKMRPGAEVLVDNSISPENNLYPNPEDT
ncbi:MAG: efflux RND transporter periplasmic adaptor subunit [Bdellovibrionota bacterium]